MKHLKTTQKEVDKIERLKTDRIKAEFAEEIIKKTWEKVSETIQETMRRRMQNKDFVNEIFEATDKSILGIIYLEILEQVAINLYLNMSSEKLGDLDIKGVEHEALKYVLRVLK